MKADGSVISAASGTDRATCSPSFSTLAAPVRDTRSVAGESAGGGLANNASRQRSLMPDANSRAGWYHYSGEAQRKTRRELYELLKSDLYRREDDERCGGETSAWTAARFVSPLKWVVYYGANDDRQTMWCEIWGPDGKLFRETDNADVDWLHRELP